MKLIFCSSCQDVRKLDKTPVICKCGRSGGRYLDDEINAEYWGNAIPLGISNNSLGKAVNNHIASGIGIDIVAFVIHAKCDTYKKINTPNEIEQKTNIDNETTVSSD